MGRRGGVETVKTLQVGMIGAGQIAPDHIESINRYAGARVVAIADTSARRAQQRAREFGIPRVYTSAAALIRDPALDAVSIAVPNKFHAAYACAALAAGKHVCLDKPFALSAAEARRVLETARRCRRVFALAMNWRFQPAAQMARELVRRGTLGEIYHAQSFILRRSGTPRFGTWFCRRDLAGGGALLDIGVHFLDLCLYLLDNFEPVAVSGAVYSKFGPRGLGEGTWGMSDRGRMVFDVDDFGTALIKMRNGATVTLDASWVLHQEQPDRYNVQLYGTEAGLALIPLRLMRFGKRKGEYAVTEPQGVPLRYPHCNRFHNWLDAIRGRDELEVKPEQALAVQSILDAIYRSARTGREVRIR